MKQWTDKHPEERRIKLVPFDQIKLTSERRDLMKGLIPYPGLTVVWGPPKSGKSLWTQDAVTRVALDWEYRGRKVHAGPVVYCCFEGQSGIKARVEAFRQKFLAETIDPVPFFLQPVTMDLVKDHGELIAVVRETLPDTPPVAIVLDTLNRSLAGSESSDTDMSAYVRAADAIREAFACSIIIVHHCGINDSRPRGHTSLTGAADAQLAVKRDGNNIFVTVEFMKDGEEGETVASRLEQVEVGIDEDGEAITSCVVVESDATRTRASRKAKGLTKGARVALSALKEAIAEAGESPPGLSHIPQHARVVKRKLWRDYAYARGISGADTPDAKRKAFERGAESLFAEGAAGVWEEWCWTL